MFNRSAFNDLSYNQPNSGVTLSAELGAAATLTARTTARMNLNARLNAQSRFAARMLIVQSSKATISARGSTRARLLRVIAYRTRLSAQGKLYANARRYQTRTLKYTGLLALGKMVVIHTRNMLIVHDGQDASHLMQGQFGRIGSGVNEVVYQDSGSQRNVLMQIEHNDTSL